MLGEGKLSPFDYRKRALIHILENGKMGFFRNETHDVVSFDECQILSKKLNESFKELKPEISKYGKYFYSLVLDDDVENIFAILNIREEYQVKELREKNFFDIYKKFPYKFIFEYRGKEIFKNFEFEESAGHFSQVNIEANKYLVNFVKDESFKRGPFNSVTELYAGSGNFTFMLSSISKKITAVELDGKLVKRGENISKEKNLGDKILFIQSSCEKFVKKNKLGNLVLLDPPRGGAKEVVKYINPKDTSIVIYISCALPTFERDLKELFSKGYKISSFSILDMFPNTYHVETVVLLGREKSTEDIRYDYIDYKAPENLEIPYDATYQEIKKWVKEKYGFSVSSLYIAQVKEKYNLKTQENYNLGKEGHKVPQCPEEKEKAITDAFRNFRMI